MVDDLDLQHVRTIVVGEPLSAVCFYRGYVGFCFDGPSLRLLGNIEVKPIHYPADVYPMEYVLSRMVDDVIVSIAIDGPVITLVTNNVVVTSRSSGIENMHFIERPNGVLLVW